MFQFLPGIILIQIATSALVYLVLNGSIEEHQTVAIVLLGLVVSLFGSFWFASIAQNKQKDILEKTRQAHAEERETILVETERQKAEMLKQTHKQIVKETNRAHAKANLKVGAMFTAAAGLGALMLFTSFITAGVVMLATTGGALTGYLVRARQERKAKYLLQKQVNMPVNQPLKLEKPKKTSLFSKSNGKQVSNESD